jgi:hypothetical protein
MAFLGLPMCQRINLIDGVVFGEYAKLPHHLALLPNGGIHDFGPLQEAFAAYNGPKPCNY